MEISTILTIIMHNQSDSIRNRIDTQFQTQSEAIESSLKAQSEYIELKLTKLQDQSDSIKTEIQGV